MQLRLSFLPLLLSLSALSVKAQDWINGGNTLSANGSLGTNSNHSLIFKTNNVERARLTNTGNWGVGTTSPLTRLHVNGFGAFGNRVTAANATRALNLADDAAVMRILRVHSSFAPAVELISRTTADGPNVAWWDFYAEPSDKSFRIRDRVTGANLDRLTIKSDGFVGIGTTTPGFLLDVNGRIRLRSGGDIYNSAGLWLNRTDNSNLQGFVGIADANTMGFYGSGSGWSLLMNTNNGNVGIGTTPATKLDIKGGNWDVSSTEGDLRIGDPTYRLKIGVATAGGGAGDVRMRAVGGTSRLMIGANDALTIAGNSNVGIGITAPQWPLDVSSGAGRIINATSTYVGTQERVAVFAKSVNNPGVGYGVWSIGGHVAVYGNGQGGDNTGTTFGVIGYSSSSPGVGTRTGVYGSAYGGAYAHGIYGEASGGTSFNAAGYFVGNVYANGVLLTSDRKFKQNISLVEHSLEQLMELKPSTYRFNTDQYKALHLPEGKQLGLLADEVKKIFPELVQRAVKPAQYNADDRNEVISSEVEYEAVNYIGLVPVLIASIQELNKKTVAENKELKEQIERQQQQIEELKQLVSKLAGGQNINTSLSGGALLQNAPNPVRGSTAIQYSLPEGSNRGQLLLTDALGRTIKAIQLTSSGVVNLDVSTFSSGVYNYSLVVDGKTVQTRKMTVKR